MGSTDIKLKKNHAPTWPDRCVVCQRESPGHAVALGTFQVTWWSTLTMSFGKREQVGVPACVNCARRLVWERRGRFLLSGALVTAAIFLLPKIFGLPAGFWRTPAVVGYGLVGVLPGALFAVFFPPPLDVTSHSDSVWYEFREHRYAGEFADKNREAVLEVLG